MPGKGAPFDKGNKLGRGRPKGSYAVDTQCRIWAETKGIGFLIKIAEGKEPTSKELLKLRAEVAMYLVDRGCGKARQSTDITSGGQPITLAQFYGAAGKSSGAEAKDQK